MHRVEEMSSFPLRPYHPVYATVPTRSLAGSTNNGEKAIVLPPGKTFLSYFFFSLWSIWSFFSRMDITSTVAYPPPPWPLAPPSEDFGTFLQ